MPNETNVPFYIEKAPPKTSYWKDSLVLVTEDLANRYEFDGYGYRTDKILDREPYFNIPKVEKLEGKKLKGFIEDVTEEITEINSGIDSNGKRIERISNKVDEVIRKRDTHPRGSYDYVLLSKDVDQLAEKLPSIEEEIEKFVVKRKQLTIELLNAQVKYVVDFFEDFKNNEAFSKIPGIAAQLIEENEKAVQAYTDFTKIISVGFTASTPFLSNRLVGAMKNSLVNYDKVLDQMKEKAANRYRAKLQEIFEKDFRNMLKEEEEADES